MSGKPNGGPAYPTRDFWDESQSHRHEHGMTLRDWFAGQALAGYCARTNAEHLSAETLANQTYIIADAMIAERTK